MCISTIAFMERVDQLITAMTSRTPENALRADILCEMRKVFYLTYQNIFSDDTNFLVIYQSLSTKNISEMKVIMISLFNLLLVLHVASVST